MGVLDSFNNWRAAKKQAATNEVASWRLGRKLLYLLLIASVLGALYFWAIWSLNYSSGQRAGIVRKLSHRGFLFKTWEGELQMGGIVTDNAYSKPNDPAGQMVQGGNIWFFSVDNGRPDITKQLEEASLKGTRVALYYDEKYTNIFFRGDTKYFITKVVEQP